MGDKNGRNKAAVKKRKASGNGESHKVQWNKVKHGPPSIKRKADWVHRIVANKDDARIAQETG